MPVFFSAADYRTYRRLLAHQARRRGLCVWAYCLMPNHVHLVAEPATPDGLSRPFGEAHRRYAVRINRREGWSGHLWQERFASFPMGEAHLLSAIRYVLLNPVRAGLCASAAEWPHSSARAHISGEADGLVDLRPAASRIEDWQTFLALPQPDDELETLRRHSRVGRPLGSDRFIDRLERATGRSLRPGRAGRKPKQE